MSNNLVIKQFIIENFVPEGADVDLSDDLNLLENGIIDSMGVLKMVIFLETEFNIALEPEEIDPNNLNSINTISQLVAEKSAVATV